MTDFDEKDHLTQIETITRLIQKGNEQDDDALEARRQLVKLYYGAAFRYLLGCLRDQETAQDLAQNFAIKLMQGQYIKHANPQRGRFRDYLKRSLRNLVKDHFRKNKGPQGLPEDSGMYSPLDEPQFESDEAFLTSLRDELVSCTWRALARIEEETNTPYERVLRLKTQNPKMRSAQIADNLGDELGKPFSEGGVRKILQRARDRFADLLLEAVEKSLQEYDLNEIEEQLVDLGLLDFCRPALAKRRQSKSQ